MAQGVLVLGVAQDAGHPQANCIKSCCNAAFQDPIKSHKVSSIAISDGSSFYIIDATPDFTQSLELAAYASTPLLMVGLAALFPVLWFMVIAGLGAMTYSVYLLYSGVPIMMNIPEEKGFIYSSSVVTCGLVLIVALMAASAIVFNLGLGVEYVS